MSARKHDPTMAYLSGAFAGNSPDAAIAAVMGLPEAQQKRQFCTSCGSVASPALLSPEGAVLCQACYSASAPKCDGCGKAITGQYVTADGSNKKWHEQCYNKESACKACGAPIVGPQVKALGTIWHAKCFCCSHCSKQLSASFVQRDGAAYCSSSCASADASEGGRKRMVQKGYDEETAKHIQALKDAKGKVMDGIVCSACKKPIQEWQCVSSPEHDGLWHKECFRCSACSQVISEEDSFSIDASSGSPVCSACTKSGRASGVCAGCGKAFAPGTTAVAPPGSSSRYHSQCFKCEKCLKQISGAFGQVKGKIMCSACAEAVALSAFPASLGKIATGSKPGRVVDPRSGKIREVTREQAAAAKGAAPSAKPAAGFCTSCGSKLEQQGARFCHSCGATL